MAHLDFSFLTWSVLQSYALAYAYANPAINPLVQGARPTGWAFPER